MPLPREPQRRPEPRKFLDASLVPLERALLARAGELDKKAAVEPTGTVNWIAMEMAAEFRALAEELRYW